MNQTMLPFSNEAKPGVVEYWIEYEPPVADVAELIAAARAGYRIPTERIESEHFRVQVN
jgi:hypothetical protein